MRRPSTPIILALVLVAAATWPARSRTVAAQDSRPRLVAIGDIHGAFEEFTAILQRAGLIDPQLRWSGGRAVLVQTGDYTDRGTDVRKVMDLLMRLERDARGAGGQVVTLLGNHEVMNLVGEWRDVTPEICATFADGKSEARRQEAWTQFARLVDARQPPAPGTPAVPAPTRESWLEENPPGCLEYREAMSPRGTYGRWLREKPIAAIVDGTLFMHAGVNPARPLPKSINEVIDRARNEIRRLDTYRQLLVRNKLALPFFTLQQLVEVSGLELRKADAAITAAKAEGKPLAELSLDVAMLREAQDMLSVGTWSLLDPAGPLWYRGYAGAPEEAAAADVDRLRDQLKLTRIVVAHTPTPDRRVAVRYNGTVLVIDTGMLVRAYMGNPAAVELSPRFRAIYLDGDVDLAVPKAAALQSRAASRSFDRQSTTIVP